MQSAVARDLGQIRAVMNNTRSALYTKTHVLEQANFTTKHLHNNAFFYGMYPNQTVIITRDIV